MKKYSEADIKKLLNSRGLKSTHQRIIIYQTLMNTSTHPTADEVYNSIKVAFPSISLATVYNTLEILSESGLANKVMTNDGYMRYDGNTSEHNHIYLTNTHEIMDFDDPELAEVIQNYFKSKKITNLKIKDIKVQINGEKINPNNKISIN